jgi:hypothetical protein
LDERLCERIALVTGAEAVERTMQGLNAPT